MTVDTVQAIDINELKKISKDKTPVLIKDKNADVYSFARMNNSWVVTSLDKSKFSSIEFPDSGKVSDAFSIDNLGQEIKNEIDMIHTRKHKAVKLSQNDKVSAADLVQEIRNAIKQDETIKDRHDSTSEIGKQLFDELLDEGKHVM